jgi:hypothetical protein
MRYIFLCFIFFTTTCFGQHKSKLQSKTPNTPKEVTTTDTTATTPKQAKPDTALAVTYQSTESQLSKKIYITDTTFFAVHILVGNTYETIFQGNEKRFTADKDLDDFITANKSIISTKKIFIISAPGTEFEKIKPVLDILRAHQFFEFKLVAE